MLAAIAGPCGFVYGGAATTTSSCGTGGTGYRRSNGGVSLLSVTRRCHEEMVKKRSGLWLLRRWLLSSSSGRSDTRRATRRGLLLLPAVHACSLNNTLTAADGQGCTVQSRKQEHERSIDLKEWMHEQGLPECKVALAEASPWDNDGGGGKSKPIHYVVASEELQSGEVALAVPKSLVVTLEKVLGDETIAELLTTNKLSELACLALYLMYEKKQGKESYWYPYIRELDRQRGRGQLAVESPLLWSQEEVDEYFAGSPMREVISERLEGIKREYGELDTVWFMAGSLFKQYPFDIPTEAFSFEIFKQAFVAVQSCVVHLQGVSLARRFALVPLGPPLLAYKSNCKAMLKAVGDFVQLEVDRPYHAGEPIVVWCGPQPNSRLLLNYGFVDEDNPYDRLSVEASLETADPLYQQKRIIVQRNNRLTVQTFQIYKGKEKEAVLEMLPYLRLGNLSDPNEMESVNFAQGPVCPVSPCNERAVLDQLASYFQRRLAGYQSSNTAELEDYKINPKKRVATQLLNIEKEILKNALVALDMLIDQLPDSSISSCSGAYAPHLK